jgi:aconitate hydratase
MWNAVAVSDAETYQWEADSTYIQEPPFFRDLSLQVTHPGDIQGARVLLFLGDSVTTDHISPAGPIAAESPAGRYLLDRGVPCAEFNSYGTRRGNHEVLMRGTFANARIKNRLLPGIEGGWTEHLPSGQQMSVYDAAMRYLDEGTPLLVLAGREYGTGSSRDWAAKGPGLLGVKAVIAQSFERIHRSNLVGMGILPLEFLPGESAESCGLTGREVFTVSGITGAELRPRQQLTVVAVDENQVRKSFTVVARVDTPVEVEYYRNGGVLQTVLRGMATASSQA